MEPREHPPLSWSNGSESDTIPVLGDTSEYYVGAESTPPPEYEEVRSRRTKLPAFLFVATCLSTFWAGWGMSMQGAELGPQTIPPWIEGLIYMTAVMGILVAHEMGHFLQALRYGVHASLPFFIPMPISPMGTMGAVIAMPGAQSHRKELFDIGLTGPLAGLVIAIPITVVGIIFGEPFVALPGRVYENFADPLLVQWLIAWLRPEVASGTLVLNPYLMAGWVGMLVTGLNMLPVSQLDGGHVIYALFGKKSYLIARAFVLAAMLYMVYFNQFTWIVMLMLVMVIGIDHPPTSDDSAPIGWFRGLLGLCSLAIPVLCFMPIPWSLTTS